MDVKKAISLLSIKRDVARKLQESWKGVEYCLSDGVVASAELFYYQHKEYADALDLAIAVLKLTPEIGESDFRNVTKLVSMPESGEPLSLEQLKQMDGKPVWIDEINCWGLVSISESGQFKNLPFVLFRKAGVQFEWDVTDSKLTLYSHLPAHIDVKAFCGSWAGEADGYADGELMYDVWRCGNCGHVEETDDPDLLPRFCPRCGRAMTPEAWTELERRLSGENP